MKEQVKYCIQVTTENKVYYVKNMSLDLTLDIFNSYQFSSKELAESFMKNYSEFTKNYSNSIIVKLNNGYGSYDLS